MLEELREDIGDIAKKAAVWITGKGFSMGLVAAAIHSFGTNFAPLIPIISLPIAAGIASLNANTSHGQREKRILNDYRKEIGAFLGIEPTRVSIEHMHMVANGNNKLGIPSNHIIKEAIERNDTMLSGKMFSHLSAMVVSIGIVLSITSGAALPTLAGAVTAAIGVSTEAATTIAVAGLAAIASFTLDQAANYLTTDFLGLNKSIANERIKKMGAEISDGKEISKEHIFSLFVEANPNIAEKIEATFGTKYDVLPRSAQIMAVKHYDAEYHISAITELVNSQRMDVTELAFAAQGMASGVQARAPQNNDKQLEPTLTAEPSIAQTVGGNITATHEAGVGKAPNAIDVSTTKVTMEERSSKFADRFKQKHHNSSYAEMVKKKAIQDIQKEDSHDAKAALSNELLSDVADIAMSI